MPQPKKILSLLRTYEQQAADKATGLIGVENVIALSAPRPDVLLLSNLKVQAQQELLSEQELMLVEQAAKLAEALTSLACQTIEIEAAKLLSIQRQDFVATLTHDLKNPLIGANRLLELFVDGRIGPLNDEQIHLLKELTISNSDSLALIKTLSDVYRFELDPGAIVREKSGLVPIVEASYKEMQTWALQRNVHTSLSVPDEMPFVYLDGSAIRRLLDNLLGNAMKFAGPDGSVEVSVDTKPGKVIIEVHDDGVGIPETERKHLFQRFSQGLVGKRYSGGSGLGLYLCRQIAHAHGGQIDCVDCKKGTLFRVSLPVDGK